MTEQVATKDGFSQEFAGVEMRAHAAGENEGADEEVKLTDMGRASSNTAEDEEREYTDSDSNTAEEQAGNDSDSDASSSTYAFSSHLKYRYPLRKVEKYVSNNLHQACLTRNVSEVRVLVSEGVDVNEAGKKKWTPLHFAGRGGSAEIVQLLLDSGAKVRADSQRHSVWQIAAAFGFTEIVRMYGSLEPASIFSKWSPLYVAVDVNNMESILVLLEAVMGGIEEILPMIRYTDWSVRERLVGSACKYGRVNQVRILLEHGAELRDHDVDVAVKITSPGILKLVLKHGADPRGIWRGEGTEKTPFEKCVENVHADMVYIFVEHEKNTQGFISGSTLSALLNSKQPQLYVSVLFDALTMLPDDEKPKFNLIPPRSLYTSCAEEQSQRFSRLDNSYDEDGLASDVLPSFDSWVMRLVYWCDRLLKSNSFARLPKPLVVIVDFFLYLPAFLLGAELYIRSYISSAKKSLRTAEARVFTINIPDALTAEFLQSLVSASEKMGSPDPIFANDSVAALVEFHWCLYGKFSHSCAFQLFVAQLFLFTFFIAAFRDFSAAGGGKETFGWTLQGILCSLLLYSITVELRTARKLGIGHLTTPWTVMALSGSALVLLGQILFLAAGVPNGQADIVNSCAAVLLWFSLLYHFLPYQSTGPLVRMILMIISDIKAFLMILFIVIIGFATAFYAIVGFADSSNCDGITNSTDYELCVAVTQDNAPGSFSSPALALRSSFSSMFGGYDLQELDDSPSPVMLTLLWVAFMLIVSIVLLNILIAIISDSFERLMEGNKAAWLLGKAKATMKMHALMSNESKEMLEEYLKDKDTLYILRPKAEEGSSGGEDWNGRVSAIVNRVKESAGEIRSEVRDSNCEMRKEVRNLAETSNQQNSQVKDLIGKVEASNKQSSDLVGKVEAIEAQLNRILEVMNRLDVSSTKLSIG